MQVMWMVLVTLGLVLGGSSGSRRQTTHNRLGQAPATSRRPALLVGTCSCVLYYAPLTDERNHVPIETRTDNDPQRYVLSTIRQSQAAVIETIRTWSTITEQLAGTLRLPIPEVDVAGLVDRTFDVAEQALAAQHQLARTLAGVTTRQVDTAVAGFETTVGEGIRRVEDLVEAAEAEPERVLALPQQPQAATGDTLKAASPKQNRSPDGRTYEERSVEELRERAGELQIEGRSAMSKDELIAALRKQSK